MDAKGIAFLVQEEGLRLTPYLDTKGIPTVGVGCTYYEDGSKVKIWDPEITKERAIELFKNVLKHYELAVYSVCRDDINQNQFNSLCSLCYNIGVNAFKKSTLVRTVNLNPMDTKIKDAWLMWQRPPELRPRRNREIALYFS